MYEDKTLVCKECGKEFVFTAGEQEFYAERGFRDWISLSSTGSAPIRIIDASSSALSYVSKLPEITAFPSVISA